MKPLTTMLETVIFDIFEKMFFLFPEKIALPAATDHKWRTYAITISGEKAIRILCLFTPQLARVMAANFIGSDESDIADEVSSETCKEALNVIAGHIVNQLGEQYQLGIPTVHSATDLSTIKNEMANSDWLAFTMVDQPFLAVIEAKD